MKNTNNNNKMREKTVLCEQTEMSANEWIKSWPKK